MKKPRRRRRRNHTDQFTIKVSPNQVQTDGFDDKELAAVLKSSEIDAAADRRWFEQHPGTNERMRPCSKWEIAAGASPNAEVFVFRLSCGAQVRAITKPEN